MKVILVNGSPKKEGCTFTALSEIKKTLAQRSKICDLLETGVYDIETFKARDNALQAKLQDLYNKKEMLFVGHDIT